MDDHSPDAGKKDYMGTVTHCGTCHHACDCRESHFAEMERDYDYRGTLLSERDQRIMKLEMQVAVLRSALEHNVSECNADCANEPHCCLRNTSQVPDKKGV